MFNQLIIGTVVIALSVVIQAVFVATASALLRRHGARLGERHHSLKLLVISVVVTLWLLKGLTVSVWLWATVFLVCGIFQSLEPAVYFSLIAFTTVGFGDIVLTPQWRILSGMVAANGLLLFGFSTAFLFEVIVRLHNQSSED